jgi:hypothetical protein
LSKRSSQEQQRKARLCKPDHQVTAKASKTHVCAS